MSKAGAPCLLPAASAWRSVCPWQKYTCMGWLGGRSPAPETLLKCCSVFLRNPQLPQGEG